MAYQISFELTFLVCCGAILTIVIVGYLDWSILSTVVSRKKTDQLVQETRQQLQGRRLFWSKKKNESYRFSNP